LIKKLNNSNHFVELFHIKANIYWHSCTEHNAGLLIYLVSLVSPVTKTSHHLKVQYNQVS